MAKKTESKEEMEKNILTATENLLIREGLQNISMRNIAKEAGIASGTLYLYFKTKEDLLHYLAVSWVTRYRNHMEFEFNPDLELFSQYQKLVRKKWAFLTEQLEAIKQFQAFMGVEELIRDVIEDEGSCWNKLISEGKKQGIIIDLPNELLCSLCLAPLESIKYLQKLNQKINFDEYLDEIILRTWKVITF